MKKFIIVLLFSGIIVWCFFNSTSKPDSTYTTLSISDILEKKEFEDSYYLTIVLDDFLVEDCSLDFQQLTIATNETLYNQITVNTGYTGVSLKVPDFQEYGEFLDMLKSRDTANWKIMSVTTADNQKLSGVDD